MLVMVVAGVDFWGDWKVKLSRRSTEKLRERARAAEENEQSYWERRTELPNSSPFYLSRGRRYASRALSRMHIVIPYESNDSGDLLFLLFEIKVNCAYVHRASLYRSRSLKLIKNRRCNATPTIKQRKKIRSECRKTREPILLSAEK